MPEVTSYNENGKQQITFLEQAGAAIGRAAARLRDRREELSLAVVVTLLATTAAAAGIDTQPQPQQPTGTVQEIED